MNLTLSPYFVFTPIRQNHGVRSTMRHALVHRVISRFESLKAIQYQLPDVRVGGFTIARAVPRLAACVKHKTNIDGLDSKDDTDIANTTSNRRRFEAPVDSSGSIFRKQNILPLRLAEFDDCRLVNLRSNRHRNSTHHHQVSIRSIEKWGSAPR